MSKVTFLLTDDFDDDDEMIAAPMMTTTAIHIRRQLCRCGIQQNHTTTTKRLHPPNARRTISSIFSIFSSGMSSSTANDSDVLPRRFQSIYDEQEPKNWRDWLDPAEYEHPWDVGSPRLRPAIPFAPADIATRHIIRLLQRFHENAEDRVSTEQCNAALVRLEQYLQQPATSSNSSSTRTTAYSTITSSAVAVARRADAMLQNMHVFDRVVTVAKLPRPFPKPNRETYNIVLRIFAKTSSGDNIQIPQRAKAIVQSMERRYQELLDLDMKPNAFHWNCVILSYQSCHHPDRALEALQVVLELLASPSPEESLDSSSFIHLLRICAHVDRLADLRAAKLGASVAIRLWQVLFESNDETNSTTTKEEDRDASTAISMEIVHEEPSQLHRSASSPTTTPVVLSADIWDFSPHFYVFFLQAIRSLDHVSVRNRYYDACFTRAKQYGRVNRYVLQEFFVHVQNSRLFDQHLGSYRKAIIGLSADQAIDYILQKMPQAWKEHAQQSEKIK